MTQTAQNKVGILAVNYDGTYNSIYPTGNKPAIVPLASFNFNGSDNLQMTKNGVSFETNSDVAVAPSGETEKGIPFTFTGSGATATDAFFERRFGFPQQTECWIHSRVFVPSNYKHRLLLGLNITGTLTAWAAGDNILAADGTSTAKVYGISGQYMLVEFAQNIDFGGGVWTGVITNTSKANIPVTSARDQKYAANNKLFAIWCDGYSGAGINPTIIFESYSVSGLYSNAYFHVAVDGGGADSEHDTFSDFITASDLGKWIDIVYYVKLSSALNVSDGKCGMYLKRNGESVYTQKINATGLPLWKRTGVTAGFQAGYLHGAQNSGYFATTILTDSLFEIYTQKPSFLP